MFLSHNELRCADDTVSVPFLVFHPVGRLSAFEDSLAPILFRCSRFFFLGGRCTGLLSLDPASCQLSFTFHSFMAIYAVVPSLLGLGFLCWIKRAWLFHCRVL